MVLTSTSLQHTRLDVSSACLVLLKPPNLIISLRMSRDDRSGVVATGPSPITADDGNGEPDLFQVQIGRPQRLVLHPISSGLPTSHSPGLLFHTISTMLCVQFILHVFTSSRSTSRPISPTTGAHWDKRTPVV